MVTAVEEADFLAFDADGNGSLDPAEVKSFLDSQGVAMALDAVHDLIRRVDEDGDGSATTPPARAAPPAAAAARAPHALGPPARCFFTTRRLRTLCPVNAARSTLQSYALR